MPHVPLTGQDQAQTHGQPAAPVGPPPPPGPLAGTHGPEMPSRPSVLHRELADRPGAAEPGTGADPWRVWQPRTEQPATQDAPPPAAGPHPASDGAHDAASDPGEQR